MSLTIVCAAKENRHYKIYLVAIRCWFLLLDDNCPRDSVREVVHNHAGKYLLTHKVIPFSMQIG